MATISNVIKQLPGLVSIGGVDDEAVVKAEMKLGVKFAPEYNSYLKEFGVISAEGIELTGISNITRLSVVDVTLRKRKEAGLSLNMYVVEDLVMDGFFVSQDQTGAIFECNEKGKKKKVASSLAAYIETNL